MSSPAPQKKQCVAPAGPSTSFIVTAVVADVPVSIFCTVERECAVARPKHLAEVTTWLTVFLKDCGLCLPPDGFPIPYAATLMMLAESDEIKGVGLKLSFPPGANLAAVRFIAGLVDYKLGMTNPGFDFVAGTAANHPGACALCIPNPCGHFDTFLIVDGDMISPLHGAREDYPHLPPHPFPVCFPSPPSTTTE